jgi:hypothetical protein
MATLNGFIETISHQVNRLTIQIDDSFDGFKNRYEHAVPRFQNDRFDPLVDPGCRLAGHFGGHRTERAARLYSLLVPRLHVADGSGRRPRPLRRILNRPPNAAPTMAYCCLLTGSAALRGTAGVSRCRCGTRGRGDRRRSSRRPFKILVLA